MTSGTSYSSLVKHKIDKFKKLWIQTLKKIHLLKTQLPFAFWHNFSAILPQIRTLPLIVTFIRHTFYPFQLKAPVKWSSEIKPQYHLPELRGRRDRRGKQFWVNPLNSLIGQDWPQYHLPDLRGGQDFLDYLIINIVSNVIHGKSNSNHIVAKCLQHDAFKEK